MSPFTWANWMLLLFVELRMNKLELEEVSLELSEGDEGGDKKEDAF